MKKCILVLTSGVTIEFNEGDEVSVYIIDEFSAQNTEVEFIPMVIPWNKKDKVLTIEHTVKKDDKITNVEYTIPLERISWAYVQEVTNESNETSEQSENSSDNH